MESVSSANSAVAIWGGADAEPSYWLAKNGSVPSYPAQHFVTESKLVERFMRWLLADEGRHKVAVHAPTLRALVVDWGSHDHLAYHPPASGALC